jgi:hypothetical protein
MSGKVFQIPVSQDDEAMTLAGGASDRFSPGANRGDTIPGASFKTRLWPRSGGALLLGALGQDAVTHPADYQHVITPAQSLPYWTLASRMDNEYPVLADAMISELTLAWDGSKPVEADVVVIGCNPTFNGTPWTVTNDESVLAYMKPLGGTFQLDVNSASPATGKVTGGQAHINNNIVPVMLSASNTPDDVYPAVQQVDGKLNLTPSDFTDWRKVVTGLGGGTTATGNEVYGSMLLKFQIDTHRSIQLEAYRVGFLADWPDSDSGGGPMKIEAAFKVYRPTDGSAAFKATVVNDVASY